MEEKRNEPSVWLIVIGVIALLLFVWYLFLKKPVTIVSPAVAPSTNTSTTVEKETNTKEIIVTVTPEVTAKASPTATPTGK